VNLPGRPRRWFLAGGLARCGHPDCGAPLMARAGSNGQVRYVCARGPGRPGCGRITIVAERLHEIVEEMLFARDWRHLELPPEEGPDESELAAALAEDETLLIELSRLHSARPQRISTPEWLAQRDEVAARIAKARELQAQRRQLAAKATTPAGGKALQEQWPGLTLEQKRAAFQRILVCVIVNPAKPGASRVDPGRVVPVWHN
jgi:site-specific DNA recombinase